ncbi:YnbE family lipoprotein [Kiloniella sp. b19]|uniref:YnbE family lipoprotein n=1 Tax=Kiloniella sp. GXU_MW_B19 TaxID=3141326 RepID=UPI0031D7C69A
MKLPARVLKTDRAGMMLSSCLLLSGLIVVGGCTPTVQVQAPQEPITINLNIKLDADVRVRLEEQAREDIDSNPDIF